MPYPARPRRTADYSQDADNNVSEFPDPAKVDTENDAMMASTNSIIDRIRLITTADGKLTGVASALALSLSGAQAFTATASQTVFDTTITWDSTFTNTSVHVYVNGTKLAMASVTVANFANALRVTIGARTAGDKVEVVAFSSGASVLSKLAGQYTLHTYDRSQSPGSTTADTNIPWQAGYNISHVLSVTTHSLGGPTVALTPTAIIESVYAPGFVKVDYTPGDQGFLTIVLRDPTELHGGAELVALIDVLSLFVATTVEDGMAELMTKLNLLITNLGPTGNLIRKDGSVAMAAALAMGSHKITGLTAGSTAGDAVEYSQFQAVAAAWDDLTLQFVKRDGSTAFTADQSMGGNKLTDVGTAVAAGDAVALGQADTRYVPIAGAVTLAAPIKSPDPVDATDLINKQSAEALITGVTGFPNVHAVQSAGTTNWTVPANITHVIIHAVSGGGGGGAWNARGGGGGGYARKYLAVTAGQDITITVGAGGAVNANGDDTQCIYAGNPVCKATGGQGGSVGTGGQGTIGDLLLTGGMSGVTFDSGYADLGPLAGSAAGPYGGQGGSGAVGLVVSSSVGVSPGGGGGNASQGGAPASAGAPGAVFIFY